MLRTQGRSRSPSHNKKHTYPRHNASLKKAQPFATKKQKLDEYFRQLDMKLQMNDATLPNLDFEGKMLGNDRIISLTRSLGDNKSVRNCNLASNGIGEKGAAGIAEAVEKNKSVTRLDLRRNPLGGEGVRLIATAIAVNEESALRTLYLYDCLGQAEIPIRPSTSTTHGSGSSSSSQAMFALGRALSQPHCTLCTLDLRSNNLDAASMGSVCDGLKANKGLSSLVLDGNQLGCVGAGFLAKALPFCKALRSLFICDNNIADDGMVALAEALGAKIIRKQQRQPKPNPQGDQGDEGSVVAVPKDEDNPELLMPLGVDGKPLGWQEREKAAKKEKQRLAKKVTFQECHTNC
jgi:hypothetical protein